ncbi:unnamed protein product [Paramecium pentaurelia]|uniref:Uncharacterized protein n=1 Tax=Paramecium pentaurelia TaxID=43138 RepID=A0A8S1UW53_9CILI|nr:unnamed protein product [Paramecium pentaurelia]
MNKIIHSWLKDIIYKLQKFMFNLHTQVSQIKKQYNESSNYRENQQVQKNDLRMIYLRNNLHLIKCQHHQTKTQDLVRFCHRSFQLKIQSLPDQSCQIFIFNLNYSSISLQNQQYQIKLNKTLSTQPNQKLQKLNYQLTYYMIVLIYIYNCQTNIIMQIAFQQLGEYNCQTCDTNYDFCPSCPSTRNLNIDEEGVNVTVCQCQQIFLDIGGQECLQCLSNCVNCDPNDPSKCISCGNEELTYRVLDSNQTCICKEGVYIQFFKHF